MKWTRQLLGRKNQKGIALMLSLFTMMFIFYLVVQITYTTAVEYNINANAISRLKAYYAARSALDLALLRLKIFMMAKKQFGDLPPEQGRMLDMIWNFPFAWPPPVPKDMNSVDKEAIQNTVKESMMDTSYRVDIVDEGSKFDLNDLDSPSKTIRETAKTQLLNIFQSKMSQDEDWAKSHQDLRPEEITNNIIDWIDADTTSKNGGDEKQFYSKLGAEGASLPPNRGFRTIDEMRMVAGMTDELFSLLKDRVTIYGMKAINPNYATAEVFASLDPSFKKDVVKEIIQRRDDEKKGGPYRNATDFWTYANQMGANVVEERQKQIPLVFDNVYNFRIKAFGESSNQIREIEAVVFDLDQAADTVAQQLVDDRKAEFSGSSGGGAGAGDTGGGAADDSKKKKKKQSPRSLQKGPPRIVYFRER